MRRISKRWHGRSWRWRGAACVAASGVTALLAPAPAHASTLTWDSSASAGVQGGSGNWDFNQTTNWTADGGATRQAWTSNTNTAAFQMPAATATVTLDASNGTLGAAGLQFTGDDGGRTYSLAGASLLLGSGGISATATNAVVSMNGAVVLNGSQTFTSNMFRTVSNGAALLINNSLSSATSTTNLTLDGQGLGYAASNIANSANQVTFLFAGDNSAFHGTTTLLNGARLILDYGTTAVPTVTNKLDDSSALIFKGGSLALGSQATAYTEVVASTSVLQGSNAVVVSPVHASGTAIVTLSAGAITQSAGSGATFDVTNATGIIVATTNSNDATGVIGAWATTAGNRWAKAVSGLYSSLSGNGTSQTSAANWGTTQNVNVSDAAGTSESGIGSKTVNLLAIANSGVTLSFNSGAVLTVTGGGVMSATAATTGNDTITGGKLTTGLASGELFVHTYGSLNLGSDVSDNATVPTKLVKAGISGLTLSGINSYTGKTYVNAGTLTLASGGSLVNGNIQLNGGTVNGTGGTLNYNVKDSIADLIDIQGGVFDLSSINLNVVTSGTTPLTGSAEYVLANRNINSVYVAGGHFLSVNLPSNWAIDYDGTALNPNSIVVTVPEPVSLSFLGLGILGLLRRRNRRAS